MASVDVAGMTIAWAGRLLRRRGVSPVALTRAYLERIERLNPLLNAYVTVTAERALADARRAQREMAAGRDRGPLHGVPIGLKDLYDTAGIRTAGGAKVYAERVPDRDATTTRKLREAGSVLLGKTNTHEVAFGVTTDNPHFGRTCNPWDTTRIPGGSSGGSGAAIAAGLAAGTMGTDTGGSIRNPAALCGVVGLKATYGRVSKAGVMPLSWLNDHAGPITHTVEDAALMLQAVAGYDPDDFSTVRTPVPSYTAHLRQGVHGLRVGVPRRFFFDRLDPQVRSAVEEALRTMRALGAMVRDVDIEHLTDPGAQLYVVALSEAKEIYAEPIKTRLADFGKDVQEHLSQPTGDAVAMAAALRGAHALAESMRRTLETVDVLVTPATPVPAPKIGQERVLYGGVEEPLLFAMSRCTAAFNITGLPAMSLPCGFTRGGLPIGMQIVGKPFDEATVLRAGYAYERATDWHARRPAV